MPNPDPTPAPPPTGALTEAQLDHIRVWHWPIKRQAQGTIVDACKRCGTPWPCHAAQLVAEVDRLRAQAAARTTLTDAYEALYERAHEWGAVPFRGPGHEEEYALANTSAEDKILAAVEVAEAARAALDAADVARRGAGGGG